jgi:hypothetical protein
VSSFSSSMRKQGPIRRGAHFYRRYPTPAPSSISRGVWVPAQGRDDVDESWREQLLSQIFKTVQTRHRDLAARNARGLHRLHPPHAKRAQGRPGARCTRGLVCKCTKENAHEHTGSAETLRPSPRNGFTAYSVLFLVTGFVVTIAPEKRLLLKELDASIGASEPHVFTVRSSRARQSQPSRPPHLTARS